MLMHTRPSTAVMLVLGLASLVCSFAHASAIISTASSANGLSLPSIFGSHMVIQRGAPFVLWGNASSTLATVTVTFGGAKRSDTANPLTGAWSVTFPPMNATLAGADIVITSSDGGGAPDTILTLTDVVVGDVYVCSGQSNMEISVLDAHDAAAEIAASAQYGARVRIAQVAMAPANANATAPQTATTMAIPWARAAPSSVAPMSAVCYYYGVEQATRRPGVPVGMISSNWGGTKIEVWMTPDALAECPMPPDTGIASAYANPDPGTLRASFGLGAPNAPSCLWNSMVAPLVSLPLTAFIWYQAESNVGAPTHYTCLFPAMIRQWRRDFRAASAGGTAADAPFLFVQVSSWPAGDTGAIPMIRYAQTAALALPNVGMAVAADIGDPSSAMHPIHPPWKQEVARRVALSAERLVHGNASVPAGGPAPVGGATLDRWDASWGSYHYGTGGPGAHVCGVPSFLCAGLRVAFDQAVALRDGFAPPGQPAMLRGFDNGFRVVNAESGAWQPVSLTAVRSGAGGESVVQLNVTWIDGGAGAPPTVLEYGWHDYPTMPLVNAFGQPVAPFNVTISDDA